MAEVPLDRLSFSRVQTLRRCSEQFRLTYQWRLPQRPAWALAGGSAFHAITEAIDFNDHGVTVEIPTPEQALQAEVDRALKGTSWSEEDIRVSGRASKAWPGREDRDWWTHNLPGMVESWKTWRRNTPWQIWMTPDGEPAIELEVRIVLGEGADKVSILGYIDRVFEDPATGRLIVLDLKSGSTTPATTHQLGLYRLGIWQRFGMLADYGTFYSGRTGATGVVHDLGEWSEDRFEFEYGAAKKQIRSGLFTPNVDRHCSWCGVREFCYAVGGERAGEVTLPWVREGEVVGSGDLGVGVS